MTYLGRVDQPKEKAMCLDGWDPEMPKYEGTTWTIPIRITYNSATTTYSTTITNDTSGWVWTPWEVTDQ